MKTHNFTMVNLDTDSIAFCKPDGTPFTEAEQHQLLADLNSNFPEKIKWAHDGVFERFCILKAKNYITHNKHHFKKGQYVLDPKSGYKKKGSSLKSSKLEPAIKEFMSAIIEVLIDGRPEELLGIYQKYVKEVYNLKDIGLWSKKVTVTEAVLNPGRTNEENVLQALRDLQGVQMGDKHYLYYTNELATKTSYKLKLASDWTGDHNQKALVERLWKTLKVFEKVIDIKQFPKYHLKGKNVTEQLKELLNEKGQT